MISAVVAALVTSSVQDPFQTLWKLSLPSSTRVTMDGGKLQIDGKLFDVHTGFAVPRPAFDFDVWVPSDDRGGMFQPESISDGVAEKTVYAREGLKLQIIGRGVGEAMWFFEGFRLRRSNQEPPRDARRIESQPLYRRSPSRAFGKFSDGFFWVTNKGFDADVTQAYQSIVVLDPFMVTPLKFTFYRDVSNPRRVIGDFYENFERDREESTYKYLRPDCIACGDLYTGKIHWKLGKEFRWAGRVGEKTLAWSVNTPHWFTVDEKTGATTAIQSSVLSRYSRPVFSSLDGCLVLAEFTDGRCVITCYGPPESGTQGGY